jgi:hypothetical protein
MHTHLEDQMTRAKRLGLSDAFIGGTGAGTGTGAEARGVGSKVRDGIVGD